MDYVTYKEIDINTINNNLSVIKNRYSFKYYILDVSNNAFGHGISIVKNIAIDYLYTNNLNDIFLIRKYNNDIPIILDSLINPEQILDAINNNVILVVNDIHTLEKISEEKLFASLNVILNIDNNGFLGFKNKKDIRNAVEIFKTHTKLKILGIKAQIRENDFHDFLYIINDLLRLDLGMFILNNESDKRKIKYSNAIKLDNSIYGINHYIKGKFLSKKDDSFKEAMGIYTKVVSIKKDVHKKEREFVIIPVGYLNGMLKEIKKVFIKDKFYVVMEIRDLYSIVIGETGINIGDLVEIIGLNNPLENYIKNNTLSYFNCFNMISENESNYIGN